ncbi:C40 family peptidase [Paenibacillus sp. CF384]|uniref:C40 family peptidase n=1 Tax=Paenibacillus sp. CF384 TaxID=1884382 RepID=UPI00089B97ED|nr:C40 family peptidase [Paenibacillus sp. CF384]SDX79794.1 peptidoglycan endopeptidase LytF [Paenibacillus sp. CF384]
MRKKTILAAISFMLLSGAVQATTFTGHTHASAVTYSIGASSSVITNLQTDLKKLGYFNYATATGYYGTVTRDAVIAFQSKYGLVADGITGPLTLEAVSNAILKQKLVADTSSYLGIPYVWGGTSPASGFDCSGFIYYMFTKFGVSQTRTTSTNLFSQGFSVNKSMLQPGDLVFFRNPSTGVVDHVGFYMGGGSFISALSSKGIYVQQMDNAYWGPRYAGARRVY